MLLAGLLIAGCGDDVEPGADDAVRATKSDTAVEGGGGTDGKVAEASEIDTTGLGIPGGDSIPPAAPGADSLLAMVAGAPSRGPADAAVVVVEFSDFECPFCAKAHRTVDRFMEDRPHARLVYVQFPILQLHPGAMLPSEAALEAHRQGRFWDYHDALFEHGPPLKKDTLLELAERGGLDVAAMRRALEAGTHREQVKHEMAVGDRLGITGTPTFFVNGYKLVGAQPYEAFVTVYNLLLRASRREELAGLAPEGTPR
ncbi:MAG: DsbA family protein [Gemmatimonadota bacterium]